MIENDFPDNLESELRNIHKHIRDAIDRQSRRAKVEHLVSKLKEFFSKLVRKNAELFDLAGKTENPDSNYTVLEKWLDDLTKSNDKFSLATRSFFDRVADTKPEEAEKREEAALRLAKQKHKIVIRKKVARSTIGADGASRIRGKPPTACWRSWIRGGRING